MLAYIALFYQTPNLMPMDETSAFPGRSKKFFYYFALGWSKSLDVFESPARITNNEGQGETRTHTNYLSPIC